MGEGVPRAAKTASRMKGLDFGEAQSAFLWAGVDLFSCVTVDRSGNPSFIRISATSFHRNAEKIHQLALFSRRKPSQKPPSAHRLQAPSQILEPESKSSFKPS